MFAVLHIADFALHAVLRTESGGFHQPAALFANTSKKSIVLATNSRARAAGVELGMTAPQAVARCIGLIIRSPHADAESEARAALLAIGFTLSPSIEATAPGVCTADVKGFDATKLEAAVGAAVTELNALGLPATGGIARTPLLALYAARKISPLPESDFQAGRPDKAASRRELCVAESAAPYLPSPAGVHRVTDERYFLTPLPLAVADPSPALTEVLANWGLRTLGDLTALPRDEIVRRFGAEGLALWQRASGGAPRPLHPIAPRLHFSARMEFENDIETLEPLLFILRRFLERLTIELRASQHVAAEINLELWLEDDTRHARSFRLPEPTAEVEILFRTLHTHLESLQTAASISALKIELTPARPLVRQQGLFETSLRDPHGFAETLARVSALVGSDRIGTPQLADTHRADEVKLLPPPNVIPPTAEPLLHAVTGWPLRRFRPPLPVRFGNVGERRYVWSEAVRGEISFQSKAYFKDGEWWQADRSWNRIEWDIALTEGGLYRLLLIDDGYFLEGEYD